MHNKFQNLIGSSLYDLLAVYSKRSLHYFFARAVSELPQFTPLASTNIPSKRWLLKTSAKFLVLCCASIPISSLVLQVLVTYLGGKELQLLLFGTATCTLHDREVKPASQITLCIHTFHSIIVAYFIQRTYVTNKKIREETKN